MEERSLLVGMDIGWKITQLSCFDFTTYEPVPIGRRKGEERQYEIPTALTILPEKGQWYWADEQVPADTPCITIENLLEQVGKEETIQAGQYRLDSYQVFKRFMVKMLSLLKEYYPDQNIKKLVVSLPDKEKTLTDYVEKVCCDIGLPKECVTIQNHRQSYMYYAISQSKELWANNVGLFEFCKNRLLYSQITIDRKTTPYIVGITQKDITDEIDWEELEKEGDEHITYAFVNGANTVLHKQLVTTVYVTGERFEHTWANEALKQLCVGRRVFRGQNLFTKGACYCARELSGQGKLDHCLFLDEEMISCNVSLRVYKDAQEQDVLLAKAGTVWSEVDSTIDVIPDDEEELQVIIRDVLKHESRAHMLSLSGFSGRENKMTRFRIRIRFADRNTCVITLRDKGFGEFCPSSHRVWERCISAT